MVTEMNKYNPIEKNVIRFEFIETLSAEFTGLTGYGVHAHLSHNHIERLFNQFITQNKPLQAFAKSIVNRF